MEIVISLTYFLLSASCRCGEACGERLQDGSSRGVSSRSIWNNETGWFSSVIASSYRIACFQFHALNQLETNSDKNLLHSKCRIWSLDVETTEMWYCTLGKMWTMWDLEVVILWSFGVRWSQNVSQGMWLPHGV